MSMVISDPISIWRRPHHPGEIPRDPPSSNQNNNFAGLVNNAVPFRKRLDANHEVIFRNEIAAARLSLLLLKSVN